MRMRVPLAFNVMEEGSDRQKSIALFNVGQQLLGSFRRNGDPVDVLATDEAENTYMHIRE